MAEYVSVLQIFTAAELWQIGQRRFFRQI